MHSIKKTFFYNFFPTKAEEDRRGGKALTGLPEKSRVLVEIRDVYAPPIINLDDPWTIKRTLRNYEPLWGRIVLHCDDAFEHVMRYWDFEMANCIAMGLKVGVTVWDFTEDKNPRKYVSGNVYLQMMANDDFVLSCMELMRHRKLKADDEIRLCWDSRECDFKFKLL